MSLRLKCAPQDEPLLAVARQMRQMLDELSQTGVLELVVPDPDDWAGSAMEGEVVELDGVKRRYRSYKAMVDLGEQLGCRMGTPHALGNGLVSVPLSKLRRSASWHDADSPVDKTEKYGVDSDYARMDKLEEPRFALDLVRALQLSRAAPSARVLVLGVNDGRELPAFEAAFGRDWEAMSFCGVDHCASALELARERFQGERFRFQELDLQKLDAAALGRFQLIFSVGTLQTAGRGLKPLFMSLVQNQLETGGSVVLGFPGCRQVDGEYVLGAKMRNWTDSDLSNLVGDVHFCKKYLQQHRFGVRLFGKYYLFLVGYPL